MGTAEKGTGLWPGPYSRSFFFRLESMDRVSLRPMRDQYVEPSTRRRFCLRLGAIQAQK